jgi:hypothetical protein
MIMVGTEDLHTRIEKLENALRAAHGKTSKDPHPLLKETYFYTSSRTGKKDETLVENAFGLLKIGSEGESRYVGPAAGSEYLQEAGVDLSDFEEAEPTPDERDPRGVYAEGAITLMDSLLTAGPAYPYTVEQLHDLLPDWASEGSVVMESYWENVHWMYQVISRRMFDTDHYENAYNSPRPHAHKLACVFFMLALGYKFDLRRRPWDPEARRHFLHGRFALSLVSLEHATPATVQAIHLMASFILNDGLDNGAHIVWPMIGTATRIAEGVSVYRFVVLFLDTWILTPYTAWSPSRRSELWSLRVRGHGTSPGVLGDPHVRPSPGALLWSPLCAPEPRMRHKVPARE